jgi:recombination protein RecT
MMENQSLELKRPQKMSLQQMLNAPDIKARFEGILSKKAPGFISSIINTTNSNTILKAIANKNPESIIRAAAVAAALDLPIDKNLGFAWIVPYGGEAQFQMGSKGYIQLGLRTGQYSKMTLVDIYENQFSSWNPMTEELEANFMIPGEGEIIGFVFYFRLVNGFEKAAFSHKADLLTHGKRYSKTFTNGPWKTHTNEMCRKTLVKMTLRQWGILSIDMQTAIDADQAAIKSDDLNNNSAFDYIDGTDVTPTIDIEGAARPETVLDKEIQSGTK